MSHSRRFSQRAPSTLKGARLVPSARTTNLILHYTATEKPFMYSISGNCAASVPISTLMSVNDLYIPRMGPHICCRRIGRSLVGIYKLLTYTWMWKLGLWPRNSFFGNICFEFSVLVLRCVLVHLRPSIWRNYTVQYTWRLSPNFVMDCMEEKKCLRIFSCLI